MKLMFPDSSILGNSSDGFSIITFCKGVHAKVLQVLFVKNDDLVFFAYI